MPRCRSAGRDVPWMVVVGLTALAVVPVAILHAALAAAAGTLFESLPFVLAGALFPRGRARALLGLAGCGCRGAPGSAALSLPAFGLCWLAFGPAAAIGRVVVGLGFERLGLRASRRRGTPPPSGLARARTPVDVRTWAIGVRLEFLERFGRIVPVAAIGGVAAELVRSLPASGTILGDAFGRSGVETGLATCAAFALGMLAGAAAPWATAGVALAGMLRGAHPALAYGALVTTGFVAIPRPARPDGDGDGDGRFSLLAIALCGAALVATGDRGFVNARLLPPIALASVAVAALALAPPRGPAEPASRRRRSSRAPVLLACALFAGSPPPGGPVLSALDAFAPGDRLETLGIVHGGGREVVRATIVCCRADARFVGVRLARRDAHRDGTWVRVRGTLRARSDGLALAVESESAVAPPRDPFAYW